jgi:beta-lactamase regulating signal transducer with metallopeptidase domain
MISIETVNAVAQHWAVFMWSRMLDATWVLLIVAALWALLRRRVSAQFGYCLFLLVLVKLVMPIQTPLPEKAVRLPALTWTPMVVTPGKAPDHAPALAGKSDDAISVPAVAAQKDIKPKHVQRASFSTAAVLMIGWLVAAALLLCRLVYTEWGTLQVIKRSDPVDLGAAGVSLYRLKAVLRIRRAVRVVAHSSVVSPVVHGVWSPTLLIPADFADHYSVDQMRWILLHELAHIQRWDTLVKLFQKIVQFLFFFHPGVWIANLLIDRQREFACDDTAVLGSNLSRADCGESFLHIVARINQTPTFMPGVLGILSPNTVVRKRLMRMLDQNRMPQSRLSLGACLWLALVALLLVPFSGMAASTAAPAASPAPAAVAAEPDNATFPTEGYTQKGKDYLWRQALSANVEDIKTVVCLSRDGDVSVKAHQDASKNTVEVNAVVVMTPKGKLANDPDVLKQLLTLKEKVGVSLRRDDKKTPAKDDDTMTVQTIMPQKLPEDIEVSVSMEILMPAQLALDVASADGDTKAKGLAGPVKIKTADGDVAILECQNSVTVTAADGDISAIGCAGPIELKVADGDVKVSKCTKAVAVKAADGDILLEDVQAQVDAKTNDGDVKVSFTLAPTADCSIESGDGDIMIILPKASNVTLDVKTGEGGIKVDAPGFEGTKKENSVAGKLNSGGPAIKARSGDGDVWIKGE